MAVPEELTLAERAPQPAPVHAELEIAQETPLFWLSLATVAVNVWDWPGESDEAFGATVTAMTCGAGSDPFVAGVGTETHPAKNKEIKGKIRTRADTHPARTRGDEFKI